jgi:carbonic anhydrase
MAKMSLQAEVSRRRLMRFGAGAIGSGLVAAGVGKALGEPEVAIAKDVSQPIDPSQLTPDGALKLLMEGNKRFTSRRVTSPHRDVTRLKEVAAKQEPFAAILGCADSRVPSEILFDRGFGDLFVCRVAGNIATPEEVGSLEFGTAVLGSKVILVLGHERCGAVSATIKGAAVPGQIGSLLDAIRPALDRAKGQSGDALENATKANVAYQIEKLKSSPVLSERLAAGTLKIVGGYYDLDTGVVSLLS